MLLKINGLPIDNLVLGNAVTSTSEFMDYIYNLKTKGIFMATFNKTPTDFLFGWVWSLGDIVRHSLHFVFENDEAFFIIPSIIILFATFLVGRNRFSKFTIPLWFIYFVSSVLTQTTGLLDWLGK